MGSGSVAGRLGTWVLLDMEDLLNQGIRTCAPELAGRLPEPNHGGSVSSDSLRESD